MKLTFSILFSLLTLCAYSQVKSEIRTIGNYSKLSVTGRCEVIYENKSTESPYLRIEAGEDYMKNIDISSQSGELSVKSNIGNSGVNFYNEEANIKIYTNSKSLEEVTLTGNSKVVLNGDMNLGKLKLSVFGSSLLVTQNQIAGSSVKVYIKGNGMLKADMLQSPELELYISGSGKVEVDEVKASRFSASISGSGIVTAKGGIANLTHFRVKGNGIIKASDVKSENSDNGVNGNGIIHANSSGYLKGRINGSGRVFYKGNPTNVERKVYGSGKVMPEDLPED